jgi:hypothetical protein
MNDHKLPKKTLLGFLKFTYWDLPKTVFGRWTLFWLYFLPAIFLLFSLNGEQHRIYVLPKIEDLKVIDGKAEFEQSRNRTLLLRQSDGVIFKFYCAAQKTNPNPCSYISEKFSEDNKNNDIKIWMHPVAGALQIEIGSHILPMHSFKAMSDAAMDTSSLEKIKVFVMLFALALFVVLPLYSVKVFFSIGK